MKKINVHLIYRRAYSSQFSIERIFDGLISYFHANTTIQIQKKVVPAYNNTVLRRLQNIIWTFRNQGKINHITGDIHYIALGLFKPTAILTIHDLYFMDIAKPLTFLIYYLLWLKLPLLQVQYVTVISEATKKELLRKIYFPEHRLRVIPNYYDPQYKPVPKQFFSDKPVLLQIGTKSNKNIPRLIEAIRSINCTLIIVGKFEKEIEELLLKNQVDYSWREKLSDEEVRREYEQCDLVCFTSILEGFGMPILEAQATGRVVITSNVSSMPEVAGLGAYYVNPFDSNAIRQGILKLIEDAPLRSGLINAGFENVQRFHISRIAQMYASLYQEIQDQQTT